MSEYIYRNLTSFDCTKEAKHDRKRLIRKLSSHISHVPIAYRNMKLQNIFITCIHEYSGLMQGMGCNTITECRLTRKKLQKAVPKNIPYAGKYTTLQRNVYQSLLCKNLHTGIILLLLLLLLLIIIIMIPLLNTTTTSTNNNNNDDDVNVQIEFLL